MRTPRTAAVFRLRTLLFTITGYQRLFQLLSALALSAGTLVLVFDLPIVDIAAALDVTTMGATFEPRALLFLAAASIVALGVRWRLRRKRQRATHAVPSAEDSPDMPNRH